MNLFSNAMKYTDNGFVKVSLMIEDEPSSRGGRKHSNLFLKVTDSGRGISKDFLRHRLYTPFAQEDSLVSGTGLGVSIVRQIVHDLGGDMHYTSEQGSGTDVVVRCLLLRRRLQGPLILQKFEGRQWASRRRLLGLTDIPVCQRLQRGRFQVI